MVKLGGDQSKAEEEFDKNYEQYKSSHSSESKTEIYDGFSKEFTEKLEFPISPKILEIFRSKMKFKN